MAGEENEPLIPVKGDKIKLRYQLGDESLKHCGLNNIDVTYEGSDIRKLWENFFNNRNRAGDAEIAQEEKEKFHNALRSHVRNTIKLRLDDRSKFILTQVLQYWADPSICAGLI